MGVVAEESCRRGVAEEVGMLDLDLDGLGSGVLFLRDIDPDPDVDVRLILPGRIAALVGEESLDAKGDAVNDVFVDVHLEGCVSIFALDVAEVSLSTELRLEKLASMPAVWVLGFAMAAGWFFVGVVTRLGSIGIGCGCECCFGRMGKGCRMRATNEPRH